MNNKKILVITEGGKTLGFGHITRTISICTIFASFGYEIEYIINGDSSIENIMNYPYQIFDWQTEQSRLEENLKNKYLILLDSILVKDDQIKRIESFNIPIIFIDDEKQRNILNKGFVVDWTILREKENLFENKKENVKYLLGSKYIPLRKEFYKENIQNIIKENVSKIMITFGGSDVRNLTPKILEVLNINFPNIKKDVIIGPGFNNLEEIKKHSNNANINLITNASTEQMIESMRTSDIAIAAGGQTLYELAHIGTPTIGILLVENAKADTIGWSKVGFLNYIGTYCDLHLEEKLITAIKSLLTQENRLKAQENAHKYISKNGGQMLVKEILESLNDNI